LSGGIVGLSLTVSFRGLLSVFLDCVSVAAASRLPIVHGAPGTNEGEISVRALAGALLFGLGVAAGQLAQTSTDSLSAWTEAGKLTVRLA